MGTPAAWTTNKKTGESGPYYYELNAWGPNYWFIVMDMDCDQTQVISNIFFLFKFDIN